jgi:hypothetical protein
MPFIKKILALQNLNDYFHTHILIEVKLNSKFDLFFSNLFKML